MAAAIAALLTRQRYSAAAIVAGVEVELALRTTVTGRADDDVAETITVDIARCSQRLAKEVA